MTARQRDSATARQRDSATAHISRNSAHQTLPNLAKGRKGFAKCLPALLAAALLLYACTPPGDSGSSGDTTKPKWVRVAAGDFHTLAINSRGHLYAWGNNAFGQLGNGKNGTGLVSRILDKNKDKNTPVLIDSTSQWKDIAAGKYHSLAIKSDGTLWAWGRGDFGQLGLGDSKSGTHNTPQQVGTSSNWKALAGGDFYSLALNNAGTLHAWGDNTVGQLGDSSKAQSRAPKAITGAWKAVAAGSNHTLAIDSAGALHAWGWNVYGELGNGDDANGSVTDRTKDKNAPVPIGSGTWKAVAAGENHSLALKSDGTLYAWGSNTNGQIGADPVSVVSSNTPRQVNNDTDWMAISNATTAGRSSLALKKSGALYAWGSNASGQLGDGTTTGKTAVSKTGTDADWTLVTARNERVLALKKDGTLYAWGDNTHGQLGDGTTAQRNSPKLIPHP